MKIEKDSRVSQTMYRKRLTFMNIVMVTFLVFVLVLQLIGYSKVIERNSYDVVLEPINFDKVDREVITSVGEIVQYN